jgi:hypothetical protein
MKVQIHVLNADWGWDEGIDLPCIPPIGADLTATNEDLNDEIINEFGDHPWMRVRDALWYVLDPEPSVTLFVEFICPETENAANHQPSDKASAVDSVVDDPSPAPCPPSPDPSAGGAS